MSRVYVGSECLWEFCRIDANEAVCRRQQWGWLGARNLMRSQVEDRLSCLWHEGCKIDKCANVPVISGFCNHRSAVGVPHEDNRI
ncbi:hypothetical protein GV67_19430 [Pseudorhizobium pelagicum]|nr:hypothetical protein GV67_19430 [Pseudorhizobium pelagicum]